MPWYVVRSLHLSAGLSATAGQHRQHGKYLPTQPTHPRPQSLPHCPHSTSHPHRLLEHAPPQREDERRRPAPAAAPLPLPLLTEPPLLPVNDVHQDVSRPVQLLLGFLEQRMLKRLLFLQLVAVDSETAGADADRPSGWRGQMGS